MSNKTLIVFLGNPGKRYEKTRHNYARRILKEIEELDSLSWKEKFRGRYSLWKNCILFIPGTAMNVSGPPVRAAMDFFNINKDSLLVIHDDLELPFGQSLWKSGGGLSGHNGLKSIKQHLGTADFLRLRLGIGRPSRGEVSSWVLTPFSQDEESQMDLVTRGISRQLILYMEKGTPPSFNRDIWIVL